MNLTTDNLKPINFEYIVYNIVYDQVYDQVTNYAFNQVYLRAYLQVYWKVYRQIYNQVKNQIYGIEKRSEIKYMTLTKNNLKQIIEK